MKPQFLALLLGSAVLFATAGCRPSAPKIPLPEAAQKGYLNAVQQHIAARSDLNATDKSGWTALHQAAMKGNLAIVKALCAAGADTGHAGPGGKTALDVARERGMAPVAQFLMNQAQAQARTGAGTGNTGRGLVDGGLGVSSVLDSQ